jgi:3-hydroxyisobutyrate dehydrogenase-like beta-hydroxyacid dehydrogenase
MGFNVKLAVAVGGAAFATINGQSHTAPGNVVAGNALLMQDVKPGTLAGYVDVTANTNTMTLSVKWQVSNDNSTFYDAQIVGASAVASSDTPEILSTGTGSSVETKKVLAAPPSVYGWRYCRMVLVVGVADSGSASDGWAYSFNYQHTDFT